MKKFKVLAGVLLAAIIASGGKGKMCCIAVFYKKILKLER